MQYRVEISRLEAQNDALTAQNEALSEEVKTLREQNKTADLFAIELNRQLYEANCEIAELKKEIDRMSAIINIHYTPQEAT